MGTLYALALTKPEDASDVIVKNISVGNKEIRFRFQWSIASEEQYNIIKQYIDTKMRSDPFLIDGVFVYKYDYVEYYARLYGLTDEQLGEWLDEDPLLPNSIKGMERQAQLYTLRERATEAKALQGAVEHYREELKWHFQADYDDESTTGIIVPGGWYRSQDPELQFRFVSPLDYIGRDDFSKVTIEFEVDND